MQVLVNLVRRWQVFFLTLDLYDLVNFTQSHWALTINQKVFIMKNWVARKSGANWVRPSTTTRSRLAQANPTRPQMTNSCKWDTQGHIRVKECYHSKDCTCAHKHILIYMCAKDSIYFWEGPLLLSSNTTYKIFSKTLTMCSKHILPKKSFDRNKWASLGAT